MNWKRGFKRIIFCANIILALTAAIITTQETHSYYKVSQLKDKDIKVLLNLRCFDSNGIPFVPDKLTPKEISLAKEELNRRFDEISLLPGISNIDVDTTIRKLSCLESFGQMTPTQMIVHSALEGLWVAIMASFGLWFIVGFTYIVIRWIVRGFIEKTDNALTK